MSVLRRLAGSRFSEILPEWIGTVAILAGGPSLTVEQIEIVHGMHQAHRCWAIAINDAYLIAPWSDVCYFADSRWWEWHTKGIARRSLGLNSSQVAAAFAAFPGQKCSIQWAGSNVKDETVHILRGKRAANGDEHRDWSTDPQMIASGRCSGYQALNLAVLAGARAVLLLGFDGKPDYAVGRAHWFGDHPLPTLPQAYEDMRRMFAAGEREIEKTGVRVINCSPSSDLGFEKLRLEDAMREAVL